MALNDLYGVGAGAYDATVQGDVDRSSQMKMDLANQQSAAMNPLMQQHQQLQNQTLQAGLPGVMGNSASLDAKGQVDQAGIQDQIKTKQQEAFSKMDDAQLKQTKNFGEKMSMLGAQLDNVPAAARPALVIQVAQGMGIDQNNPQLQALLKAPPEQLNVLLKKTGETMAMSSGEFLQKRAMELDKTNALLENNKESNASRERIAALQADSKQQLASSKQANTKQSLEQKLSSLLSVPEDQRDSSWDNDFASTFRTSMQLRAAGSNQLGADVINGTAPATPASKADAVIKSVTGSNGRASIDQGAVQKAFGSYEPNKYDYRVGPNGQVQRKAKG